MRLSDVNISKDDYGGGFKRQKRLPLVREHEIVTDYNIDDGRTVRPALFDSLLLTCDGTEF